MADDEVPVSEGSSGSAGKWILLALAARCTFTSRSSLYFIFDLRGRLDKVTKDAAATAARRLAISPSGCNLPEADDETLAYRKWA